MSKNIIDKTTAEEMAINYQPKLISSQLSDQALKYVGEKEKRGDFRVDKIVAEYTGIDELEKLSQQRELEQEAIKLSQSVQEDAYKEAYSLGTKEGSLKAYDEAKADIEVEVGNFKKLIDEVKNIKIDMLLKNEAHIVSLSFYLAKRLLMKEVEADESYIKDLIKKTLEMAQSEEEITIRISPEDYKFLEANEESIFKELGVEGRAKFEEDPEITRGGVVLETNYGVIDSTIEQRLEKMESLLKNQINI